MDVGTSTTGGSAISAAPQISLDKSVIDAVAQDFDSLGTTMSFSAPERPGGDGFIGSEPSALDAYSVIANATHAIGSALSQTAQALTQAGTAFETNENAVIGQTGQLQSSMSGVDQGLLGVTK
jgi:hypothetical protein